MRRRIITGLVVVLALAAPAAAQSRREMQMMADIRMLQEQTQQLQQLASAIDQLSATLKTINGRVDEQAAATRKSFADQKLAVDQFGNDLRIVYKQLVVHPRNAMASALAFCAANEQGKAKQLDVLLWDKGFKARQLDNSDVAAAEAGGGGGKELTTTLSH